MADETLLTLTADIVAAHVSNNTVAVGDLPTAISSVYSALANLSNPAPAEEPKQEPAVSVRASIKPDYLVSLESGKKVKMLKRYLMTNYGMTPDDYRKKWNLPADYPMAAPNYKDMRRELAKKIGLGRKPGQKVAAKASAPRATTTPRAKAAPAAKPKSAAAAKRAAQPHLGGDTK